MKRKLIVIFVEGETEKEFYSALLNYYHKLYKTSIHSYKVLNLKGISRFENKVISKLKYEIFPEHPQSNIVVVCCYDSDVFEFAPKPPVNWGIVKTKVQELGIEHFIEIRAVRMIEDWFLHDLNGLSKFLKIPVPKRIEGKNGLDKIKALFKKGNKPKIYQKGTNTHKFIPHLNISMLHQILKNELMPLESILVKNP